MFASLLGLMSTLPGFYFAGLAAVSTFGGPDMDVEMPPPNLEIDILVQGKYLPTKLTRRQFLSYLFSYLVVISFVLCFALVIFNAGIESITLLRSSLLSTLFGAMIWAALKFAVLTSMSLLFASLTITTLHGIYFLTDKMHRP
ncbi:hypothetical protein [Phyllobacterium sp. UNC302MFCol5.2]|uniref:hypothetical protein n=1 Tax=Phyllobacterium sp. UNC302MFCol5.2 TaxID=1449065 RepID=UPI0012DCC24D|nr:hypothetical protein [Phyllobacterium sp. UNC302MFCol5.2]